MNNNSKKKFIVTIKVIMTYIFNFNSRLKCNFKFKKNEKKKRNNGSVEKRKPRKKEDEK